MYNENYSIVFSSMTGNTRKLADKIHEILPKESCDYFGTAPNVYIQSKSHDVVFGNWISVMNQGKGSSLPLRDNLAHVSGKCAYKPWIFRASPHGWIKMPERYVSPPFGA